MGPVHDILCPGLSVRVGKQGQKTFTVKYRYGLKQRGLRLAPQKLQHEGESGSLSQDFAQEASGISPH